MTAFAPSDLYSSQPSLAFPAAARPGGALDYFFMRRRSTAIGEQFWSVVARGWADFNALERTRSARLFSRYRSYWTPDVFALRDRAAYDELPDDFIVYRGQNGVELATGAAFSLSKDVARRRAAGRRNMRYSDPTILSLRVAKRDVALALASRGEAEIVLFPAQWRHARLEAMRPLRTTH